MAAEKYGELFGEDDGTVPATFQARHSPPPPSNPAPPACHPFALQGLLCLAACKIVLGCKESGVSAPPEKDPSARLTLALVFVWRRARAGCILRLLSDIRGCAKPVLV